MSSTTVLVSEGFGAPDWWLPGFAPTLFENLSATALASFGGDSGERMISEVSSGSLGL